MVITLDQLKTSLQAVKNYANDTAQSAKDIIADEFDASTSYEVGDYVFYDGKLYRFTAAHPTGAFDGTDATEVTVSDELNTKANKEDFDMSIGTVTTLSPGTDATANLSGNYDAMVLDLGLPRGDTGDSGVYIGSTAPTGDENVWIDTSSSITPNIVNVEGTDPVIVAEDNHMYICGEVTSLDFTPCASGICDVRFTSGSTVTVLTLPSDVHMPDGFVVETNRIYELNFLDGLGVYQSWQIST